MPLVDRYSLALMSQWEGNNKRVSLHSGPVPTDANRIVPTSGLPGGYVYEDLTGGAINGEWFNQNDTTPGLGLASPEKFRQYASMDFRVGGKNPPVADVRRPDGTMGPPIIRSIAFEYASSAGGVREELSYVLLAWAVLEVEWPPPDGPVQMVFRQPGLITAGQEPFTSPYVEAHTAPAVGARGGVPQNYSVARSAGRDLFARWFQSNRGLPAVNQRRYVQGNADLTLATAPHRAAAAAGWPPIRFGLGSRLFIHGGDREAALDLVNVEEINFPATNADRTIPEYWRVRLANSAPVPGAMRGVWVGFGIMGPCRGAGRILPAGRRLRIPKEALCISLWPRWDAEDFLEPEPGQIEGLAADTSDRLRTALSWDVEPGAQAYLLQVASEPSFAAPLVDCVHLEPRATVPRLVEQEHYARVAGTGDGGAGEWSPTLAFTPGARPDKPFNVTVENIDRGLLWKWDVPEGTERCEVRFTGPPSGTQGVVPAPEATEWSFQLGGPTDPLEIGTVISLEVRTTAADGTQPSDWSDPVEGTVTSGVFMQPTGIIFSGLARRGVYVHWQQQATVPFARIEIVSTPEGGSEATVTRDVEVTGGAGTALITGKEPGSWVRVRVRELGARPPGAADLGPWSAQASVRLIDLDNRPGDPTDGRAVASAGKVTLSCALPADVRWALFRWTITPVGGTAQQGSAYVDSSLPAGASRDVPGPEGAVVSGRAWSASSGDPDTAVLSANPTPLASEDPATATIPTVLQPPVNLRITDEWPGGRPRVLFGVRDEGIVRVRVEGGYYSGPGATGTTTIAASGERNTPVVPGAYSVILNESFSPTPPGFYVRIRAKSIAADGQESDYTEYVEKRSPTGIPAPADFALGVSGVGDVTATWTNPPGALQYIEIQQINEVPSGTVTNNRRKVLLMPVTSFIIHRRAVLSKTLRARARYVTGRLLRPERGVETGAGDWSDWAENSIEVGAPSVTVTEGEVSAAVTIASAVGVDRWRYKLKTAADWTRAPAAAFTIRGLAASTEYTYEFQHGNLGGWSDATEATFTTEAGVIIPLDAPTVSGTTTQTTLTTSATRVPGAAKHQRRLGSGAWVDDNDLVHTYPGLSPDSSYTVSWRGVDADGNPGAIGSITLRTDSVAPPPPPATVPDRPTAELLNSSPSNFTGRITAATTGPRPTRLRYRWRRDDSNTWSAWDDARSDGSFTIRTTTGSLSPNTFYRVEVGACNANGCNTQRREYRWRTSVTLASGPRLGSFSYVHTGTGYTVSAIPERVENATHYAREPLFTGPGDTTRISISPGTRFTLRTGVRGSETVSYRACAYINLSGSSWDARQCRHGTFLTPPPAPAGVALNPPARRSIGARVRTTTGATKYQIKLSTETEWTDGKERLITGLDPDTLYVVQGRAGNSSGWGPAVLAAQRTLAAAST